MAIQDKSTAMPTGTVHAGTVPETHKQLARSVYDAFNQKQYDRCAALAADNVEVTTMPFGVSEKGKDGFKRWLANWGTAMPDCKIELKRQYATEDGVISEFHAVGTHKGPLQTPQGALQPTGNKLELDVIEAWDVKDGKVQKIRCYFDGLKMMKTFGGIQ